MGQLEGKIALVSGAGSGIGRATAIALAEEGAKVAVCDIDEAGGKKTVALVTDAGGEAAFWQHNVIDEERWREVIAETAERWGGLHILVNNAGVGKMMPVTEITLEDWRSQTAINIDGVFLGTKHAIPVIAKSGGGSITNISSIAGLIGAAGLSCYCATKGAVRLFTKAVAMECAQGQLNIRVNSVHPGIIDTPIWGKLPGGGANRIDAQEHGHRVVPLGTAADPAEVAAGIVFLSSKAASHMTGAELVIDGGMMAGRIPPRDVD